jgi:Xaa-Pro aminopeptidase
MTSMSPEEQAIKLERARQLMDSLAVDGLLLRRASSFAWATGGAASYVNTASSEGAASLLITRENFHLITTNIEAPRLEQEEGLAAQGWQWHVAHWWEGQAALTHLTEGLRLAADGCFPGARDASAEMARLRALLTPAEGERFRSLGRLCAAAMDTAARSIRPGMSEVEIAACLGKAAQERGVQPIVNLVATDERISHYRHPLPTAKTLQRYALLVLSGRKAGLVCSISRLVHFGAVPAGIRSRVDAALQVNAALVSSTRPGRSLGEILAGGQAAYAAAGFPEEWRNHHQGGVVGYEPREYLALPGSADRIQSGQAVAWNPSLAGAKVEDTILVGQEANEILTAIPGWPVEEIMAAGCPGPVPCPQVLLIS